MKIKVDKEYLLRVDYSPQIWLSECSDRILTLCTRSARTKGNEDFNESPRSRRRGIWGKLLYEKPAVSQILPSTS
jgi:hypothetical protein